MELIKHGPEKGGEGNAEGCEEKEVWREKKGCHRKRGGSNARIFFEEVADFFGKLNIRWRKVRSHRT